MTLTPEDIVRLLAECTEPSDNEYGTCLLCRAELYSQPPTPHAENCPWLLACAWVAEHPA